MGSGIKKNQSCKGFERRKQFEKSVMKNIWQNINNFAISVAVIDLSATMPTLNPTLRRPFFHIPFH
jgi:hypothetical protein